MTSGPHSGWSVGCSIITSWSSCGDGLSTRWLSIVQQFSTACSETRRVQTEPANGVVRSLSGNGRDRIATASRSSPGLAKSWPVPWPLAARSSTGHELPHPAPSTESPPDANRPERTAATDLARARPTGSPIQIAVDFVSRRPIARLAFSRNRSAICLASGAI